MEFGIWQLKENAPLEFYFRGYDRIKDRFDIKNYEVIYNAYLDEFVDEVPDDIYQALNIIYNIFNAHRPEDFHGHSLSVSDIVKINGVNYYCDSWGWKEIKI